MAEQELAAVQLASMDELTMLSNRRGFNALCLHTINLCRRMDKPASLLYFDLDLFKSHLASVNPDAAVIEVSAQTGDGLDRWLDWLRFA